MRVTGWTVAELRAAPARVVRAHCARIYAGLVWNPDLAKATSGPPPPRESYGSLADWAAARSAQTDGRKLQALIESMLWPEDDDGK